MPEANTPKSIGGSTDKKEMPDSVNRRGFLRAVGGLFKTGAMAALLLANEGRPERDDPLEPIWRKLENDRIPGATRLVEIKRVRGAQKGFIHISQQHSLSDRQRLHLNIREQPGEREKTIRSQRNVESVILHLKTTYGLQGVMLEGTTPSVIEQLNRLRDTHIATVNRFRTEVLQSRQKRLGPVRNDAARIAASDEADTARIRECEARLTVEYFRSSGAIFRDFEHTLEFINLQQRMTELGMSVDGEIFVLRNHPNDAERLAEARAVRKEREAAFQRQADVIWYAFEGASIKLHFEGKIDLYPVASDAFMEENTRRLFDSKGSDRRALKDDREDEAIHIAADIDSPLVVGATFGRDHLFQGGEEDDDNIDKWNRAHPEKKLWLAVIDTID